MIFTDNPERIVVDIEHIVAGQLCARVHWRTCLTTEHLTLLNCLQVLGAAVDEHRRDAGVIKVLLVGVEVNVDEGALEVLVLLDKRLEKVLQLFRASTSSPVCLSPVREVEAVVRASNHVSIEIRGNRLLGSSVEALLMKLHK